MPVTGRTNSFAPADFAENLIPVHPPGTRGLEQLNWATHFALGALAGAAYGIAARAGVHGSLGPVLDGTGIPVNTCIARVRAKARTAPYPGRNRVAS